MGLVIHISAVSPRLLGTQGLLWNPFRPLGLWSRVKHGKHGVMPWKFWIWHRHWSFSKSDRQVLLQLFTVCGVPSHPATLEWALKSKLVTATIKTHGLCLQTNIYHFGDTLRLPMSLSRKWWNIFSLISSWPKQSIDGFNCITGTWAGGAKRAICDFFGHWWHKSLITFPLHAAVGSLH